MMDSSKRQPPNFGAPRRVSLRGPVDRSKMQDLIAESRLRKEFPFLFVNPDAATERRAWAGREVGVESRLSPTLLRAELGWHRLRWLRDVPTYTGYAAQSLWHRGQRRFAQTVRRHVTD